jgi:hypothetical protein
MTYDIGTYIDLSHINPATPKPAEIIQSLFSTPVEPGAKVLFFRWLRDVPMSAPIMA